MLKLGQAGNAGTASFYQIRSIGGGNSGSEHRI